MIQFMTFENTVAKSLALFYKYKLFAISKDMNCPFKELSLKMLPLLGCVPPWMSSENVCSFNLQNSSLQLTLRTKLKNLAAAITTTDFDFTWDTCKQPCVKTKEGLV